MMKKKKERKIKRDLSIEDMPHNRFEVFTDIIKIRWDILIYIGLILLLFFIPLIVAMFTKNVMVSNLYTLFLNGEIEENVYRSNSFQLDLIFTSIEALCLLVLFIPLSGIVRIIKLLCFYEGIVFFQDLIKGFKENYKQMLGVFFLTTLLFFISKISICFLVSSGNNDFISTIIFFLPAFLSFVLFVPMIFLHISQISIYNNKFFENIKNSFFLYLKSGLTTLPMTILVIAPLLLLLINILYSPIIFISFFALICLPLSSLAFFLHSNWIFDKNINKETYPEIFDKGIYRK